MRHQRSGEEGARRRGGRGDPREDPGPPGGGDAGAFVFGRHAVEEYLAGGHAADRLFVADGAEGTGKLVEAARRLHIPVQWAPREQLDRLTQGARHQGVALRGSPIRYADLDELLEAGRASSPAGGPRLAPLLVVLDHLTDPQNVGAILRTAEAVSALGVVIAARRGAPVTGAVMRASAGAAGHVPVARVSSVAEAVERIKAAGFWTFGADGAASVSLWEARFSGPLALVIGSEGEGLSALVKRRCDEMVRIPMWGRVASLNASAATAVALYEIRRQQVAGAGGAGRPRPSPVAET